VSRDRRLQQATTPRYDVYRADEAFLSGTGADVIPIPSSDARAIRSGRSEPSRQSTNAPLGEAQKNCGTNPPTASWVGFAHCAPLGYPPQS
jgi:hypothetical protein